MIVTKDAKALYDNLKNPEFKIFYDADTVEPKDQKLNFEDWKVLASAAYPQATEEDLQTYFSSASTGELLDFTQYEEVMIKVKADAADLTDKLKDSEF